MDRRILNHAGMVQLLSDLIFRITLELLTVLYMKGFTINVVKQEEKFKFSDIN